MKSCERCLEVKPFVSFYNCAKRKDGKQGYCKACCLFKTRERLAAHPEISRQQWLKRRNNAAYREQRHKASAKYTAANRVATNARIADWQSRNLDKHAAYQGQRRATKLRATPKWANRFFISETYNLAKLRTKMLGYEWHVDHIVPLKSPIVCGLHVEHNLQVITGPENTAKSNKRWPDMPQAASGNVFNLCGSFKI